MEIKLDKIESLLEKNLVDAKVRGYSYEEQGTIDNPDGVLKPNEENDAWIKSEELIYEPLVDSSGNTVLNDDGTPVDDTTKLKQRIKFDNNVNLRKAISQTIYDVLTDADSTGENITTDDGVYGGGNKTPGTGTTLLKNGLGITLQSGNNNIVINSNSITINGTDINEILNHIHDVTIGADTYDTSSPKQP